VPHSSRCSSGRRPLAGLIAFLGILGVIATAQCGLAESSGAPIACARNEVAVLSSSSYDAVLVDEAPIGSAVGELADGGICETLEPWSGRVVLCERGSLTTAGKIGNVMASEGLAVVVYNNVPGNFYATCSGAPCEIPAVTLSQEDGQFVLANLLGLTAVVTTSPCLFYDDFESGETSCWATSPS